LLSLVFKIPDDGEVQKPSNSENQDKDENFLCKTKFITPVTIDTTDHFLTMHYNVLLIFFLYKTPIPCTEIGKDAMWVERGGNIHASTASHQNFDQLDSLCATTLSTSTYLKILIFN
jgi:hypothetical protein